MHAETTVSLLAGLPDEAGALERDLVLRGLSGRDQEWLFSLPPSTPRARATSELLFRTIKRVGRRRPTRQRLHGMALGDRDNVLLKLYELSFGSSVALVITCPRPRCGCNLDADIALDGLALEGPPPEARYHFRSDTAVPEELWFRLPTVRDELLATDPVALLEGCVLEGASARSLSADSRSALEQAIERVSPKLPSAFDAVCAECGGAFAVPFDPAALLLDQLFQSRRSFDREVHWLSFHYHWPLSEVLALTPARRGHYVRLLGAELGVA